MLEQLYPIELVEKNKFFAFLIGFSYGIIGIGSAIILFSEDPALVAVALISILSYPTITSMMKQEEVIESSKEEFNLFIFFKDHKFVFGVYILFFIGVFLAFALFSLVMPSLATNHIFKNQLAFMYGPSGGAVFSQFRFSWDTFNHLFFNNIAVLTVIFSTALFFGEGGVFLITWNASVWGTIFGNLAKTAAYNTNKNLFLYLGLVLLIITPHMLLEIFAYIASATTGGVISRALIKEKILSKRFNYIMVNTIISLLFAIFVLFIAMLVETLVLHNASIYMKIISQSRMVV